MNNSSKLALIFDMDGVMVDNNPFHKKAWRAFVQEHGFEITEEQMQKHIYGKTNRDTLTYLFGTEISDNQIETYAKEKEEIYRALYKNDIQAVKGLLDFLDLLAGQQIPMAVATSAPPSNVEFVLESIGAKQYFDIIVDDTAVKNGKPDPEVFLQAASKLGIDPAHCIVIEDSLSGIKAAQRANMQVIAVATTHSPAELAHADQTIYNFSELSLADLRKLLN